MIVSKLHVAGSSMAEVLNCQNKMPKGTVGFILAFSGLVYFITFPSHKVIVHSCNESNVVSFPSRSDVLYHRENVMFCNMVMENGMSFVSAIYR